MITAEEERILVQESQEAIPEDDSNEEAEFREMSEEDLLLKRLDKEHIEDYLEITRAVRHTDLSEDTVMFAVKMGLEGRK